MNSTEMSFDINQIASFLHTWTQANILTIDFLEQIACVGVALVLAWIFGVWLKGRFTARFAATMEQKGYMGNLVRHTAPIIWLGVLVILMQLCIIVFRQIGEPFHVFRIVSSLSLAIGIVYLSTSLFNNRTMARFIQITAIILAVLTIFKLYRPTMDMLGRLGFSYGESFISVLAVFKGLLLLVLLMQSAAFLSRFFDRRVNAMENISPSLKALINKTLTFAFFTLALVISVKAVGISLTGLAIFSSAVGVGIGFGLRKVFSNLVSGVILLLDKSLKPGDTIEVGNTYGMIKSINARFTSVISRDNKEYLVPNENLISTPVINWTCTNEQVRLRVPVGVSYDSDLEEAVQVLVKAADGVPRVMNNPKPAVRVRGFGADSIDMELRVWISDPENGTGAVKHNVCMNIWRLFKDAGIEMPYPQRDLHLRSVPDDFAEDFAKLMEPKK